MDLQTSGLFFVILLSCTFGIQLNENGYTGVLIAINPAVPEDPALLQSIEDMIKDASSYLYYAAGKRFYFKEVTVLVPSNWAGKYERAKTERYDKAHVIIDEPNRAYGDEPYTLQYGQCGDEGQYIHLTPNFMLDDNLVAVYAKRGRVLVHEWAHLRWGLYDEYSDEEPFYLSKEVTVEATRCSKNIDGEQCTSREDCGDCAKNTTTGLPTSDCMFLPNQSSTAKESIMAYPGLNSVSEFCTTETHNAEAPNRQNQMCGNRAALDVILNSSVDAGAQQSFATIPSVNITFVQRKSRVVCLTLDVSSSMSFNDKILRLRQAATLFLREIIEDTAHVGIVQFSTEAEILKGLTEINGNQSREDLVSALPTGTILYTYVCKGLLTTLEVLKQHDQSAEGDEIVLLTDGEATDNIMTDCFNDITRSNVIVHTIALGKSADNTLKHMSDETGGIFFYAAESLDSNELVDAFASLITSDGNLTHQAIQLESSGNTITDWFNGTFSVDWTVGKDTAITIVYEVSGSSPIIFIEGPSGESFTQSDFIHDPSARTLTLRIPGTAQIGEWHYSLLNMGSKQAMAITVTTRAASANVPPITVRAHMDQNSADGRKAMLVYAAVTQKGLPVIMADVTATLESDAGHMALLQLEDNGAGADAFRHDGIYSAYFIDLKTGRYSLKVRVQNKGKARISTHRRSGAPYIPGYVVNGQVVLNPPKPPVNNEPVEVGSFSRTATGESFVVELGSTDPPLFPPCKIIDLKAKLEGENVTLTWTAPGAIYDQGTASLYHIHWSKDLELLRREFNETRAVNTSALSPQEAGSIEEYTFSSSNFNITNGTTVFFAIAAENADPLQSEMSNIARVVKFEPPVYIHTQQHNSINVIAIAVSGTVAAIVVMIAVIFRFNSFVAKNTRCVINN
ncbi:calcium-activated chloride channel regulator 1-like [Alosa alosa]|uniref:calcium-activated chloride channel regulator 1-like n=1 Tax=Alosa alosa TaxID=278164 RepID=UPI0020151349|nr:calcium-activated chloride channel regulator 1-like [Alosa alosa]